LAWSDNSTVAAWLVFESVAVVVVAGAARAGALTACVTLASRVDRMFGLALAIAVIGDLLAGSVGGKSAPAGNIAKQIAVNRF
jgi:hypothetical protein